MLDRKSVGSTLPADWRLPWSDNSNIKYFSLEIKKILLLGMGATKKKKYILDKTF